MFKKGELGNKNQKKHLFSMFYGFFIDVFEFYQ